MHTAATVRILRLHCRSGRGLVFDQLDALRQVTFWAFDELIAHAPALLEGAVALHADGREMRKNVGPAAFGFDESEALGIVEPLDGAERHVTLPHSLILALVDRARAANSLRAFTNVSSRSDPEMPTMALVATPNPRPGRE